MWFRVVRISRLSKGRSVASDPAMIPIPSSRVDHIDIFTADPVVSLATYDLLRIYCNLQKKSRLNSRFCTYKNRTIEQILPLAILSAIISASWQICIHCTQAQNKACRYLGPNIHSGVPEQRDWQYCKHYVCDCRYSGLLIRQPHGDLAVYTVVCNGVLGILARITTSECDE
jgi:hypothetical protein